jgi:protease II
MPFFIRIDDAAKSLSVTRTVLEEFEDRGWIRFTKEAEITYLKGDQQYRAKFIVHLRDRLALTPMQISKVLDHQKAPYSLSAVKQILETPDR